jgi:hypothetical protein
LAPESSAIPVVMMTAKATMPMNILGKPNTELCGVCITWPQEIHGFTSQTVVWFGSLRTSSFSSTRMADASHPTTPVISSSHPNGRSRVMAGREAPEAAGVRSESSANACSDSVPVDGEMLGMAVASFVWGAPAQIVSPQAGWKLGAVLLSVPV